MSRIFKHTPLEDHFINGHNVIVKREDMCGPEGAPTFSKIRGLIPYLRNLKHTNPAITTIGYVETSVSMAGWGLAWACSIVGYKCVIFDPIYKPETELEILRYHREQWARYGAKIIPIKAGMARVNWNICKNTMQDTYGSKGLLLNLGLPLKETIDATAKEVLYTVSYYTRPSTIIVNVGSGTIAAGILKGLQSKEDLPPIEIIGVMGRTGDIRRKYDTIFSKACIPRENTLWVIDESKITLTLKDPGWEYTTPSTCDCPFPSHPWYDLKAWQWLESNIADLKGPVLFWNIGRYDHE